MKMRFRIKNGVVAFIIISVLGTLGHFLYEWTNENYLIGLFFPVNESIWEHLKLIFYPSLIYFFLYNITAKNKPNNIIAATAFSIFTGMFYIISIYYTAKGVIGRDVEFINISLYFVAVIITLCRRKKIIEEEKYTSKNMRVIASSLLFLTAFLFAVWSYCPPSLGIFNPPIH